MNSGLCSLKTRLWTQPHDRPIHQCHNLLLSSLCSSIKTQFEAITCLHEGLTPPSRHPDISPRRSLCVFSPFISTSIPQLSDFLFHSGCPVVFFQDSVHPIQFLRSSNLNYCTSLLALSVFFSVNNPPTIKKFRVRQNSESEQLIGQKFLPLSQTAGILASKQSHKVP